MSVEISKRVAILTPDKTTATFREKRKPFSAAPEGLRTTNMIRRRLTASAEIAPIMFGGNVFGWTVDEPTSHALLDRFMERGFNAIDTADVYMAHAPGNRGGESETIIGTWLKRRGRRDDVVIATKVGMWAERPGLAAANIEAAVEDSLGRLQTDYVDVYFAHCWDDKTPVDETMAAFDRLSKAGKVRAIGASNYSAAQLSEAASAAKRAGGTAYSVLQPLYNLYDREGFEAELRAEAAAEGLGLTPYFSLASGFLTGKYRSEADLAGSRRAQIVSRYLNPRGLGIVDALTAIAEAVNATPAQVAIAWLIAQPGVTAAIASATSLQQLDDVLDAADLKLTPEALEALDKASAAIPTRQWHLDRGADA